MIGLRQQAGQYPLSLPVLITLTILSSLFLAEIGHGQANYYFKGSNAPIVKSLPRIGRRSDGGDISGGRGSPGGGGETPGPIPILRSLESPGGMMELWQNGNNANAHSSNPGRTMMMDSYLGSSQLAPNVNSQLSKALMWRRLFGDGGNDYGDLLDSLYRNKS